MIPLQDHPSSRSPPAADNSAVKEMSVLPIHESPLLSTTLQSDPDFPMYAPRGRSRVPSLPFVVCHAGSKSSSQSSSYTDTTPSPIARSRRAPSPSRTPPMHVTNTASLYTLSAQLPIEIQPEMITVSAKKGDRIDVVADAWHMETDCEYYRPFSSIYLLNTMRSKVITNGKSNFPTTST